MGVRMLEERREATPMWSTEAASSGIGAVCWRWLWVAFEGCASCRAEVSEKFRVVVADTG